METNLHAAIEGLKIPVDQPGRMIIVDPFSGQPLRDEEGNVAFIDLLSNDSDKARRFDLRRRNDELDRLSKNPSGSAKIEDTIAENQERLASLTVGWHLVTLAGRAIDLPFSVDAALAIYRHTELPYIYEQALRFQARRANFAPASSKN